MIFLISACAILVIMCGTWAVLALGQYMKPVPPAPPPGQQPPPYTYADYLRDLHDKDMSISDILDKCGGVIPTAPPPAEPASTAITGTGGLLHARGGEAMAIFERMAGGNAKPIVPPPVPVLVMKVWQVPCDQCSKPGSVMHVNQQELEFRALQRKQCKKCGGTGALNIQDGRR